MSIRNNLIDVESRIQAVCQRTGRSRNEITLVGVSKKHPASDIVEAIETTSLRDFGENYVQEYINKREALVNYEARFHFIGHLQRNKVRQLMAYPPDLIHSVDSVELVVQLNRVSAEVNPDARQAILVELRIGDEGTEKTGLLPENLSELAQQLDDCRHLHWMGLMIVPPIGHAAEESRPYFKRVHEIFDSLNMRRTEKLTVLSYGMSEDYEVAIEEGATHIRVGTSIFGSRQS